MITSAHVSWLEGIVRERLSSKLNVAYRDQWWCLTLVGDAARLFIDSSTTSFESGAELIPCGEWVPSNEGFEGVLAPLLPTPGMPTSAFQMWRADEDGGCFGYDVLSLTSWMLSRAEEVGSTTLDDHGRFPAAASHAFRHGYLERPIVDEWFHILRQLAKRVWPSLELVPQTPSMRVSHDVDSPSRYAFGRLGSFLRTLGGDVLKRHDLYGLVRGPKLRMESRTQLSPRDSSNTFDWIMDRSEEHGLTSAFYFICGRTDPARDALYEPEDTRIRALMRRIHDRGHEVGLHPSYGTYRSPELIVSEASRLRRVCAEEGIYQSSWGGRMHFLRWETPTTLHGWEEAGMTYDSSMSYADRPGFRCGTCHEYPAFDPVEGRQLRLMIRPLVAMECTVMAPRYLGLGDGQAALDKFVELKNSCRAVGGCFTTLWHNTYFETQSHRDIYSALLAA